LGHLLVQVAISTDHDAVKQHFVRGVCLVQSLARGLVDQLALRSVPTHCQSAWRGSSGTTARSKTSSELDVALCQY
jgi:hypothetical protein